MPTGAVPVAASRSLGGWRRWIFWVVQAVASSRQAAFVAVASVAEILEPADAAAPEIPVDVHMPLPTGPSRPALRLVVLASSFCRRSTWGSRCRHVRPSLGHSSWRWTGPFRTSDRRRRDWIRCRGFGGRRTFRETFLLGQGHFLGPPFGTAFAMRSGGPCFVGLRDPGSGTRLHDCVCAHEARNFCVLLQAHGHGRGCHRRHCCVVFPVCRARGGVHRPVEQLLKCLAGGICVPLAFHLVVLWVCLFAAPPTFRLPEVHVVPWRAETPCGGLREQIDSVLQQAGTDVCPVFCHKSIWAIPSSSKAVQQQVAGRHLGCSFRGR